MLPPAAPYVAKAGDVNGTPYLYIGGKLRRNFELSADLTLPKIPQNHASFYADWLMLIARYRSGRSGGRPFVQINLLRWARYHYRPEVAYTWAGPDGKLIYADSRIFLEDRKVHRFSIALHGPTITMGLDQHTLCHARTADFFRFPSPLYFQIGDEVNRYGDSIDGTASDVRLKTDADNSEHPYAVRCMLRDRGLYWASLGNGTYRGRGVLERGAPSTFTGVTANAPCELEGVRFR